MAVPGVADGSGGEQQDHGEEPDPQPGHEHRRHSMHGGHGDKHKQRDGEDRVAPPVPWPFGHGRSPCFRQVVEQASQVGPGLGVHGPADSLVELGLVQAAVTEVLGQAVGDRLPLSVGNPQVLIGIQAAEQRRETTVPVRAAGPLLDREIRRVGTASVRGGMAALLNSLHPRLTYRDGMFTYTPLTCLLEVVGADRVMFSVDYPYSSNAEGREFVLGAPISEADREKIGFANAARLLGLGSSTCQDHHRGKQRRQ